MMGESHGVFYNSGIMAPGGGIGSGINGGDDVAGDGFFGSPPPRLLTREDSAVCLRMTVRGNYVSHSPLL